eukprot:TRINITY_DN2827_c0_g1_i3.p1 TRINITY_DN2827_c0_g1~~TRINITY_DN2827_c0_g1_i3.p1  ORF type:complete len:355 (-),score=68.91 TRINITY_DN2827_c0_g1_i3:367-1311(-)
MCIRDRCLGELARLTIPAERAYGAEGMRCAMVPPDSTLVFVVELVTVGDHSAPPRFDYKPVSPLPNSALPATIAIQLPHLRRLPEQNTLERWLDAGSLIPESTPELLQTVGYGEPFMWDSCSVVLVDWTNSEGALHEDTLLGWQPDGVWSWRELDRWEVELGEQWVQARHRAPVFEDDEPGTHVAAAMRLGDYFKYMRAAEVDKSLPRFYVNGWKLFNCVARCWDLGFADIIGVPDSTPFILHMAHKSSCLEGVTPSDSVDFHLRQLCKVFISPAGCITRMHFDRQSAHGWFYQALRMVVSLSCSRCSGRSCSC